jgi:hypothetical protein
MPTTGADRFVFSKLAQWFDWRSAVVIVKPTTLIGWHRAAVLRKNSISTEISIITAILTKSGGISPSILMMQAAEYRLRNYPSSLAHCFHFVVCRQFLPNLIGDTGS